MRVIANLVIISLILWSIYISFMAFNGVTVYFPLIVSEDGEIPFHRLQSMRIAVLLTFSYYGICYLFKHPSPGECVGPGGSTEGVKGLGMFKR